MNVGEGLVVGPICQQPKWGGARTQELTRWSHLSALECNWAAREYTRRWAKMVIVGALSFHHLFFF